MTSKEYITQNYPKITQNKTNEYELICNILDEFVSKINMENENIPLEDIYQIFYVGEAYKKICKAKYFNIRSFAKNYLEYKNEPKLNKLIKTIKKISLNELITEEYIKAYYFSSLDNLLDSVDSVGANFNYDSNWLLKHKTLFCLLWRGFSVKEIVSIQKTDISKNEKSIIYRGNKYIFDEKYFEIIYNYSVIDNYKVPNTGVDAMNVSSKYLFRTNRAESINEIPLSDSIYKFNKEAVVKGKQFTPYDIRRNAQFYEIYMQETINNIESHDIIRELFPHKTKQDLDFYNLYYDMWKNVFMK